MSVFSGPYWPFIYLPLWSVSLLLLPISYCDICFFYYRGFFFFLVNSICHFFVRHMYYEYFHWIYDLLFLSLWCLLKHRHLVLMNSSWSFFFFFFAFCVLRNFLTTAGSKLSSPIFSSRSIFSFYMYTCDSFQVSFCLELGFVFPLPYGYQVVSTTCWKDHSFFQWISLSP